MNRKVLSGAVVATAVGLMFMTSPLMAQDNGMAGTAAKTQGQVKCMGANDCAGTSACKTATSPGRGKNSCKGEGYLLTKTVKECMDKGGHVNKS